MSKITEARWRKLCGENLDELCEFDRIENKMHKCRDIHAAMRLAEWYEVTSGLISDLEWSPGAVVPSQRFNVDPNSVELSDAQLLELIRCGVLYCDASDIFCMA